MTIFCQSNQPELLRRHNNCWVSIQNTWVTVTEIKRVVMNLQIEYVPTPTLSDIELLTHGLSEQATAKRKMPSMQCYAFFLRNDETIYGGINGVSVYGNLAIDQLWLNETVRGQGYGQQLVAMAEQWGRNVGCRFATLETMEWEARPFYEKLGFYVEYTRNGYFDDTVCYCMRKDF